MTPKTETIERTENLKCLLTEKELLAKGREQADKQQEAQKIKADAKRVASDFKAKADAVDAQLSVLANTIASGYEFRDVRCPVVFHSPEKNRKTVIRQDTGETVRVADMDARDYERAPML